MASIQQAANNLFGATLAASLGASYMFKQSPTYQNMQRARQIKSGERLLDKLDTNINWEPNTATEAKTTLELTDFAAEKQQELLNLKREQAFATGKQRDIDAIGQHLNKYVDAEELELSKEPTKQQLGIKTEAQKQEEEQKRIRDAASASLQAMIMEGVNRESYSQPRSVTHYG